MDKLKKPRPKAAEYEAKARAGIKTELREIKAAVYEIRRMFDISATRNNGVWVIEPWRLPQNEKGGE